MLQTIILSIYTVLAPMIQALFQNRKAIIYFLYGVAVKLVLQIPLIYFFKAYGTLLATTIGLIIPIVLMYQEIRKVTGLNPRNLKKRTILTCILTVLMTLVVLISEFIIGYLFQPSGRISSFIYLAIIGGIGVAVYGGFSLSVRLLDRFIGERAASLRRTFHIK